MISIHDNNVYAYVVECELQRLTLHTEFRDHEPHEFTDVVFSGVVAHQFEHSLQGNMLFDVEECDPGTIVHDHASIFASSWREAGWPAVDYKGDLTVLENKLKSRSIRGFQIGSSYGMSGWVLAESCELATRDSAAQFL
jgi:hypothetical protein